MKVTIIGDTRFIDSNAAADSDAAARALRRGDEAIDFGLATPARADLGWQSAVRLQQGMDILYDWVLENAGQANLSGDDAKGKLHVA